MGKLIGDLRKAVVIGEKYGLPENVVLSLLTLETLVTELMKALIYKCGEEKFFAFFKEVSKVSIAPLSDIEVNAYRRRFKKVKEVLNEKVK